MTSKDIKNFILENRAQFDQATPPDRMWAAIEQSLMPQTLEQFVDNHNMEFDIAEPNPALWNHIARQLGKSNDCETVEAFIAVRRETFNTAEPGSHIWNNIEKALPQSRSGSGLETFIQANRSDFDEATPSFRVWADIDKTLHPQEKQRTLKVLNIRRVLSVAASVLLLLAVGAASGVYYMRSQTEAAAVASLEDISPEYAEMVRYYNEQIDTKARQVSQVSNDKTVLEDLKAVDKAMAELEAELQKAPKGAEEQIVANLVKSYQIKLDILQRVLERIQSVKKDSVQQKQVKDEISI
jgi:hypothetical protein